MNKLERLDSLPELLRVALQSWQSDMWTAMPGYIQSFDPVARTCEVKIALKVRVKNPRYGTPGFVGNPYDYVEIAKLTDCPAIFPSGGGFTLTFPITKGDECLVILASRCIDNWWAQGGLPLDSNGSQHSQNADNVRMHNLSDGFVLVGVNSKPNVIPNISTNSTQLRNDAGDTYVEVKNGVINVKAITVNVNSATANIVATTSATITSPSIILKNAGTALKKLVNDTFVNLFNNHTHTSAAAGASTSVPNNGSAGPGNTTSTVQAE